MIWKLMAHLTKPSKVVTSRREKRIAARDESRAKLHEALMMTRPPSPYEEQRLRREGPIMAEGGMRPRRVVGGVVRCPDGHLCGQDCEHLRPEGECWRDRLGHTSPFRMPLITNTEDFNLSPRLDEAGKAVGCPDGGKCHHEGCERVGCFRVQCCAPLSGVFPHDEWPRVQ